MTYSELINTLTDAMQAVLCLEDANNTLLEQHADACEAEANALGREQEALALLEPLRKRNEFLESILCDIYAVLRRYLTFCCERLTPGATEMDCTNFEVDLAELVLLYRNTFFPDTVPLHPAEVTFNGVKLVRGEDSPC